MGKFDLLLLFSGGLDSTLLLRMALDLGFHPICLLVDYGQKHVKELEFAEKICDKLAIPFVRINLQDWKVNSKLTGDLEERFTNVSPYYVPGRNLIFLSLAFSIVEDLEIDLIWYGANYQDRLNLFPDCYQDWVVKINELFSISGSHKIKVEAPLLGMTKKTIELIAKKKYNIKKEDVFSGYGE